MQMYSHEQFADPQFAREVPHSLCEDCTNEAIAARADDEEPATDNEAEAVRWYGYDQQNED